MVLDYSTSLSGEWREEIIMKLFRDGDTRILICMNAAGMGLDILDIDIVIQWGVSSILTFSGWYQ